MRRLALALAVTVPAMMIHAVGAGAQQRPAPPAAPTVAPTAPAANDNIKALAAEAERLKVAAKESLKALDQKQQQLEQNIKNTKAAQENVDELIAVLKDAANRVAPTSPYIKALTEQASSLRQYAATAGASPNENIRKYQPRLNAQIDAIDKLRADAGQTHSGFAAEIARLERSKDELVFASVIAQTEEFISNARSYLASVRQVFQQTSELASRTEKVISPETVQ